MLSISGSRRVAFALSATSDDHTNLTSQSVLPEMGINSETQETIGKFKDSVDTLRDWQEKYMDEIEAVTEAMDKNAKVTRDTTQQLDRTNDVLAELGPVTERIAESIGWVQHALPSFRKRPMQRTALRKEEKEDE